MNEIRRVFGYCARYRFYALATFACAVFSTLGLLVFPFLTGPVFDLVNTGEAVGWAGQTLRDLGVNSPRGQLAVMAGLALAAFLVRDGLNAARIYFNNHFEQQVIYDIRGDLYGHIQKLRLSWFDDKASGDIMTRISEDVANMERVLIDGIEQGSVALLQIVGLLIFLFILDEELALWTLLPIPFMVAGAWWYTTTAHKRYRLIRRATSAMNALLMDNLQGIAQIKTFTREEDEWRHFQEKSGEVRSSTLVVMRAWALYNPAMTFLASSGTVLVIYAGGNRVLDGSGGLTQGGLVSFLVAVGFLYDPINRLHQLNQLVQSGRAAAERVFAILDTPPEPDRIIETHAPEARPAAAQAGACEVIFDSVGFEYEPGQIVLHDIQIHARPGETIALVGPTGAGKSTLVGLIPRFYHDFTGRITLDGQDNRSLSLTDLRARIGVVSQEPFLFNDTLRRNILFGRPDAKEADCWEALQAANAASFVRALPRGLDTVVGERGIKLSVGEKQRVSIARALIKNPPLLILDEATASVDTETEKLIQEALNHLLRNRTSFVIAHRLSTIVDADQILVLNHGNIIEQGRHEALLQQGGLYSRLCRAQSTGTIEAIWREQIN
ncbi:MAG: ABC transporter ATP-binding protein [Candidatus Methylacidiphilales bacterium]